MKNPLHSHGKSRSRRGSILVIVLVICLGLVSLTLVFGHTMLMAYRGSDNALAAHQANQAIQGAARYAEYLVANATQPGAMPDPTTYQSDAVAVDDATFWFIGVPGPTDPVDVPTFGLVDEASKLNLNTATSAMLMQLPNMTQDLATAIVQWRTSGSSSSTTTGSSSSSSSASSNGSTSPIKGAPYESMEELALVTGTDPTILYGDDSNLNHILDPNEGDGSQTSPTGGSGAGSSNSNGNGLQSGLLEYVTVFSREPNVLSDGTTPRVNVTKLTAANKSTLTTALTSALGDSSRAEQITNALFPTRRGPRPRGGGGGGGGRGGRAEPAPTEPAPTAPAPAAPTAAAGAIAIGSVLGFYVACPSLTGTEFDQIAPYLSGTGGEFATGLVNVNTASEAVLACVPGLANLASQLVAARQNQPQPSTGFAWVKTVLGNQASVQAGPYLTWRSFQITADVAAVGRNGRGYQRTQFIIDSSLGVPRIVYSRNLAGLGWAVGSDARDSVGTKKNTQ